MAPTATNMFIKWMQPSHKKINADDTIRKFYGAMVSFFCTTFNCLLAWIKSIWGKKDFYSLLSNHFKLLIMHNSQNWGFLTPTKKNLQHRVRVCVSVSWEKIVEIFFTATVAWGFWCNLGSKQKFAKSSKLSWVCKLKKVKKILFYSLTCDRCICIY